MVLVTGLAAHTLKESSSEGPIDQRSAYVEDLWYDVQCTPQEAGERCNANQLQYFACTPGVRVQLSKSGAIKGMNSSAAVL